MSKIEIWGALLFANTNWNNRQEIEYFIETSKNITVSFDTYNNPISLFQATCMDLSSRVSENFPDTPEDFFTADKVDFLILYSPFFYIKIGEELNEVLVQETFEEFDITNQEQLAWIKNEDGEDYYKNKYQLLLEKFSTKLSLVKYQIMFETNGAPIFKYRIQPSIQNIESYIYSNLMEYLKVFEIPIRCNYCSKLIEAPSKIQVSKAKKREPVFHTDCFKEHRKEKDRLRKEELRKK